VANLEAARTALIDALGVEAVLADPLALRLYARDASMVEGGAGLVVFVRSPEDVVTCMQVAARHDLPVVPRGSGTGLAGGATPLADAIVVVTAKMNRILEVRPEDRLAWVEPGVFNLDLGNASRPTGFTYAPDPSSQQVSSIGGNVNTNAGGPHCLAYGVTSAHVLAVDVVLPDGSVERFGSEGPAAPGYDLRGYVVGSEGTLGIVTAVCVRLTPLPPAVRTMLLDFADVDDCAQTVSAIIARGVVPAALEMMDRGSFARSRPSHTRATRPTRRRSCWSRSTASRRGSKRRRARSRPPPSSTASARSGSPPTKPSAHSCGRVASRRSVRSRGSHRTTTCTIASYRGRRWPTCSRASTRSRSGTT